MDATKAQTHESVTLRRLGVADYLETFSAMQAFTDARTETVQDEIWLLQHPPVFTMGLKGRGGARTHINGIPLVYSDRGGDITYHGPGQLVVYPLIDLNRRRLGAKWLVHNMEQTVIDLLDDYGLRGQRRPGAPGVYVDEKKIASLGLRVRRGASYHGIALNVDMNLAPFGFIDPCGYPGQLVTQLLDLGISVEIDTINQRYAELLRARLGYTAVESALLTAELPLQEKTYG